MRASRNGSSIEVPLEAGTGEVSDVKVWNDTVPAEYYPQEIHSWFTGVLGLECRLVGMPESTQRILPREFAIREDDVVNAIIYFLSDEAAFLTGVSLDIDGGEHLGYTPGLDQPDPASA